MGVFDNEPLNVSIWVDHFPNAKGIRPDTYSHTGYPSGHGQRDITVIAQYRIPEHQLLPTPPPLPPRENPPAPRWH